jgi:hypothetical protein
VIFEGCSLTRKPIGQNLKKLDKTQGSVVANLISQI